MDRYLPTPSTSGSHPTPSTSVNTTQEDEDDPLPTLAGSESDPDDPDYPPPPQQPSTSKGKATRRQPIKGKRQVRFNLGPEEPADDPPLNANETVDPKQIKVNDHIIWDCEGQVYPAIVRKKFTSWCQVTNMLPANTNNLSLWSYGPAIKQCHYKDIKHLIAPPALQGTSSGRGNTVYLVQKIAKYWDQAQ